MRGHERDRGFVPASAEFKNQTIYDYLMQSDSGMQCMQHFAGFFAETGTSGFAPAMHRVREPGLNRICGRFGDSFGVDVKDDDDFDLSVFDLLPDLCRGVESENEICPRIFYNCCHWVFASSYLEFSK
jgi:hypothetical protein